MNWTTLIRLPQPEEFEPGAKRRAALVHAAVEGDTLSLCNGVDLTDGEWIDQGEHPENVAGLDSCSICWSVLERRQREERGLPAIPSQRLNWRRGAVTA
jgi:hypothetical protein